MSRAVVITVLVVAFGALALPAPREAAAAPALAPASVACLGPDADAAVIFNWGPDATITQYWLDLTVFQNDFAQGTYISAGPFSGDTRRFTWDGIRPGIAHFARLRAVNSSGGTTSSNTITFKPCSGAAEVYTPNYDCLGNVANVFFNWTPMAPGGVQYLDLSIFDNGFQPGTFLSFGPLSPATDRQLWQRIQPNVQHYFRVNTFAPNGWVTSATATFTANCQAPACSPTATTLVGTTSEAQDEVVDGSFTYYYDHSTPAAYRHDFEVGVRTMLAWMSANLGSSVTEPTCLEVRNKSLGGVAGLTYGHRFYIFTGDPYWSEASPGERSLVAMHELFHVFEEEGLRVALPIAQRPWWMIEGAADAMSERAAGESRLIDPVLYDRVNRSIATLAPDLQALEGSPNGNVVTNYVLANLAVQYLADKHGVQSVARFFQEAGNFEWHVAFHNAFGQTVEDFYADFNSYRNGGFQRH